MELAARLAFLGCPVDLGRLYEAEDREYILFLRAVLVRLSDLHRREYETAKQNMGS